MGMFDVENGDGYGEGGAATVDHLKEMVAATQAALRLTPARPAQLRRASAAGGHSGRSPAAAAVGPECRTSARRGHTGPSSPASGTQANNDLLQGRELTSIPFHS